MRRSLVCEYYKNSLESKTMIFLGGNGNTDATSHRHGVYEGYPNVYSTMQH